MATHISITDIQDYLEYPYLWLALMDIRNWYWIMVHNTLYHARTHFREERGNFSKLGANSRNQEKGVIFQT